MTSSTPSTSRMLPPTRLPTLPPPRSASTLSTRSALSTTNSSLTTPSLLTPNTRAEAEAAFSANSAIQTDAAAPTTPNMSSSSSTTTNDARPSDLGVRPPFPTRSSTNYFHALEALAKSGKGLAPAAGVGVALPAQAATNANETATATATAPEDDVAAGVGGREDGLDGGLVGRVQDAPGLARQQSWSQQDMHRVMQERLMAKTDEADMGYGSSSGDKA